jgi:hypothetical protein
VVVGVSTVDALVAVVAAIAAAVTVSGQETPSGTPSVLW